MSEPKNAETDFNRTEEIHRGSLSTMTLLKSQNQSVKSCGGNGAAEMAEHFRGLQLGLRGCVEADIKPLSPLYASKGL